MPIPFATAEIVTPAEMNELARAHWRKTTAKQVVNTVTETDLLNGEITIDAGAMSTNRMLRLIAIGDLINNTAATQAAPRLKLKLGATTIIDTGALAASWATNAGRFGWEINCKIANLGAANSQWSSMLADMAASTAAANAVLTTGEGFYTGMGGADLLRVTGGNSSAVDTTAAQALALTVILPVANAALDMTLKYASVEIV
jgi:hypothetical protein